MTLTQVSSRGVEDTLRWSLGASGTDHYTFTGPGLTGTVNDPTIYLSRGQTYIFENNNSANAHPFQIQSVAGSGGTAYNTGVTNNGGAGGTEIKITVPHDAPDNLYYQCTAHANMGGTIFITGAVADNSITSTKIANDTILNVDVNASAAIAGSKIDPTFTGTTGVKVPVGNTSERVNTQGMLRFNTSTSLLEYYDGATWKSIDAPPAPASVSPTNVESSSLPSNLVITGNNFGTSVSVTFIDKNGTETNAGTTTRDSATQITAQIPNTLTSANEPYSVKVTNTTSNLASTIADAFNIDAAPVFGVAAGSLGTIGNYAAGSGITAITATDDEGDTITFSVTAGSLPAGISLGSNGVFSGTATAVSSSTTSTFTVTASDGTNTNTRQYSITVQPIIVQLSGSGTWSVPSGVTSAEILIVAGGSSGSRSANVGGGGGGAGGIVHRSSYTFTSTDISNGIAYVVGAGGDGVGISPEAYDGGYNSGGDSTFAISTGTITAKGGGGGGGYGGGNYSVKPGFGSGYYQAEQGGSGGGGAWSYLSGAGSNQGTFSGWTSYGYGGGNGFTNNSDGGAGGGGAAGSGGNVYHPGSGGGAATVGGDGGAGQLFSSFTAYGVNGYFGGGGGGGSTGTPGSGGIGGGGDGGDNTDKNGHDAIDGTGGGGGGSKNAGYNNYTYKSGDGGNGTILIKY